MYFVIFFLYHMKPKLGMFETRIHRQERETKPTLVLQTPRSTKDIRRVLSIIRCSKVSCSIPQS